MSDTATASKQQAPAVSEAEMNAFKKAQGFTIVKRVFQNGNAATYQPLATAASVKEVEQKLKSTKGATHVMATGGPVIPASALVPRTYTLTGKVANLALRTGNNSGKPFATFDFQREGKDDVAGIAFGLKVGEVAEVATNAGEQPIKLFGYFKDDPRGEGQQFHVLKAIAPGQ